MVSFALEHLHTRLRIAWQQTADYIPNEPTEFVVRLTRSDLELEVLMRRIEDGEIDLQPEFQRGEIWNRERKRRLVDSILRSWYIPPIHIVRDPESSSDAVLDGQQRLASIRDFFNGKISVDGRLAPIDDRLSRLDGIKYSDLPEEWKRRVRRFPLTVVTLTDYEPEEPYELFFRLNQSYALTPSEKRNAFYGLARTQIKELVEALSELGLLKQEMIGFGNTRLAYDDVIARVTLTVAQQSLRETISSNTLENFYRSDGVPRDALNQVWTAGKRLFEQLEQGSPRPRLNKATLFTWLVCMAKFESTKTEVSSYLTARFEYERQILKQQDELPTDVSLSIRSGHQWFEYYLAVYNDRASYRVADTFSVLARDLIVHAANALYVNDDLPSRLAFLKDVKSMQSAETQLRRFLAESDWGLPSVERLL